MDCSKPDFLVHCHSRSLFKLMSIKSVIPSNYFIFCCPLLLPPSIFPSIRVFSNESVLRILWPPGQSIGASAAVLPVKIQDRFPLGWTGLILQSKGLKSLLQHHSSKASILLRSVFLMVQLSHPYITTGKNHSFD